MKKITRRAFSVLLLAVLVIVGLTTYVLRYIDHGAEWALYFNRLNSGSSGELLDRNGVVLVAFSANENRYAEDVLTRTANYHVTGDYWGRTGTGILSTYWNKMQGFSLLTGTTRSTAATTRLFIDAGLNNTAYAALNGRSGCVLVTNYQTGELVCMVSSPAVDPADPNAEPAPGAYINRALSAVFVPGSIFKLITAAAAIENLPKLEERRFYCEGKTEIAGVEINCSGEHYTQTFEQALANSCNVAFAKIATLVGQDTLIRYVREYGFLDTHTLGDIPTAAGSFPLDFVGDPELGGDLTSHAWFVGFLDDAEHPYAFVVLVENGGGGLTVASPIAARVLQHCLRME